MPDQTPAYANYLMPQSSSSVINPQLGNDYLSNLEQTLNQQEHEQMNQLLAQQNQRGTVSSGDTNYGLAKIAGNTQNQFGQAYTGLANQAIGQAQGQQFNTQYETQGFQNALQAQAQQAAYQQQLLLLQKQLGLGAVGQQNPQLPSFGQTFGQSAAQGLPGLVLGNQGQPGLAQNSFNSGMGYFNQQPQAFMGGNQFGGQFGGASGLNLSAFPQAQYSGQYAAAFNPDLLAAGV